MRIKSLLSFILVFTLLLTLLVGCGAKDDDQTDTSASSSSVATESSTATTDGNNGIKNAEQVTLKIMLPDEKQANYDAVNAEIEKRTKDSVNVKLDVTYVAWADLAQKTQITLAAGDALDLIFDAPWLHMESMIAGGYYEELTGLLDKYGENIIKTRSQNMWDSNKFDGKIMGIPLGVYMVQPHGYNIRKDLREKLGMAPIKSYEDLEKYLYAVKENFPEVIPAWGDGNYATAQYTWAGWRALDDLDNIRYTEAMNSSLLLYYKGNDGKVNNLFETSEPKIMDWLQDARKLYKDKVLDNDLGAKKDAWADYQAGKVACVPVRSFDVHFVYNDKAKATNGAEYEAVTLMDYTPGKYVLNFKMDNFICVPKVSKNKERAIQFLEWTQSNIDNYLLVSNGIEGEDFKRIGDEKFEPMPGKKGVGIGYYSIIWTPPFNLFDKRVPDENIVKYRFIGDGDNFIKDVAAGFTFNAEPVKNELAQFKAIEGKYYSAIFNGMVDPVEYLAKFKAEGGTLLKKIQDELQKQLDAYTAKSK